MIGYDRIAQACSVIDSRADGGESVPDIAESYAVDPEGLQKAAYQRALRALGILVGKGPMGATRIDVQDNRTIFAMLEALYIDGFVSSMCALPEFEVTYTTADDGLHVVADNGKEAVLGWTDATGVAQAARELA